MSTTTPVPDMVFDKLLKELTGNELKVLLYIIRRTYGFGKNADAISLSQFKNGIKTRDEKVLDKGCGLDHNRTILVALASLEKKGYISSQKRQTALGDADATIYKPCLKLAPEVLADNRVVTSSNHVVTSDNQGSYSPLRPWLPQVTTVVTPSNQQETVLQQTDSQESRNPMMTEQEREKSALAVARPSSPLETASHSYSQGYDASEEHVQDSPSLTPPTAGETAHSPRDYEKSAQGEAHGLDVLDRPSGRDLPTPGGTHRHYGHDELQAIQSAPRHTERTPRTEQVETTATATAYRTPTAQDATGHRQPAQGVEPSPVLSQSGEKPWMRLALDAEDVTQDDGANTPGRQSVGAAQGLPGFVPGGKVGTQQRTSDVLGGLTPSQLNVNGTAVDSEGRVDGATAAEAAVQGRATGERMTLAEVQGSATIPVSLHKTLPGEQSKIPEPPKPTRTRTSKKVGTDTSKPEQPKPAPAPEEPPPDPLTVEEREVFEAWNSIFEAEVPLGPTTIEAVKWLNKPVRTWADLLKWSLKETLEDMRRSCYARDTKDYFKRRGVRLYNLKSDFEIWQSAKHEEVRKNREQATESDQPKKVGGYYYYQPEEPRRVRDASSLYPQVAAQAPSSTVYRA